MGSCAILGVTSGLDAHVVHAFGPEFLFSDPVQGLETDPVHVFFFEVRLAALPLNVQDRHPKLPCRCAVGRRIIDQYGIAGGESFLPADMEKRLRIGLAAPDHV
jgi:hypothetical protein